MLGLRLPEKKKPVGEFRILVIGAKGVGKTSILTKVRKAQEVLLGFFSLNHLTTVLHRCLPRRVEPGRIELPQRLPAQHKYRVKRGQTRRVESVHHRRARAARRAPIIARSSFPGPSHHRSSSPGLRHHGPGVSDIPQVTCEHYLQFDSPRPDDPNEEEERISSPRITYQKKYQRRGAWLKTLSFPARRREARRTRLAPRGILARGPDRRRGVFRSVGYRGRR